MPRVLRRAPVAGGARHGKQVEWPTINPEPELWVLRAAGDLNITNAGSFELAQSDFETGATHGSPHTDFANLCSIDPIDPKNPFAVQPAQNSNNLLQ